MWIVAFSIFIGGGFYEHLQGGELGYFLVGFFVFLPCVMYPLLRPGDADKERPLLQRQVATNVARCSARFFVFRAGQFTAQPGIGLSATFGYLSSAG